MSSHMRVLEVMLHYAEQNVGKYFCALMSVAKKGFFALSLGEWILSFSFC